MATKSRMKSAAQTWVAQSDADAAEAISKIGVIDREVVRLETEMNDQIAQITLRCREQTAPLRERALELQSGVQTWCEANRSRLTDGGKVKFHNFTTGSIQWRQCPPKCVVSGVSEVIERLRRLKKLKFLRTKEEINKEAILSDPDAVKGIPGIKIVSGVEDFTIEPFEQTVDAH